MIYDFVELAATGAKKQLEIGHGFVRVNFDRFFAIGQAMCIGAIALRFLGLNQ